MHTYHEDIDEYIKIIENEVKDESNFTVKKNEVSYRMTKEGDDLLGNE